MRVEITILVVASLLFLMMIKESVGYRNKLRKKTRNRYMWFPIRARPSTRTKEVEAIEPTSKPTSEATSKPTTPPNWLINLLATSSARTGTNTTSYCQSTLDFISRLDSGTINTSERKRTSDDWFINCVYISVVVYEGQAQMIQPLYTCCSECQNPQYEKCVDKHPAYKCHSDAVRCVAACIKKEDPNERLSSEKCVQPSQLEYECVREVEEDGKPCIRLACYPLQQYSHFLNNNF